MESYCNAGGISVISITIVKFHRSESGILRTFDARRSGDPIPASGGGDGAEECVGHECDAAAQWRLKPRKKASERRTVGFDEYH